LKSIEVSKKMAKLCPNGCGEMTEIKTPCLVSVGSEVSMHIDIDLEPDIPAFALIPRVCPECGHHETVHINQDQFEAYIQRKLKIEYEDRILEWPKR